MPIPFFVGEPLQYWLPAGTHRCTLAEIEERLVYNPAREKVWRYFMYVLERIRDLGASVPTILLDGSFVTGREIPGDVDAACLVPPDDLRRMIQNSQSWRALQFILTRPHEARELFGVHLFFVQSTGNLEELRLTFARGLGGNGLREADPERDPVGLVVPDEKGILEVAVAEFFDQGDT